MFSLCLKLFVRLSRSLLEQSGVLMSGYDLHQHHHGERFTTALRVPDHTVFVFAVRALNTFRRMNAEILLVARIFFILLSRDK